MISVKSGFTASPPCIDVAYSSITSTLLPAGTAGLPAAISINALHCNNDLIILGFWPGSTSASHPLLPYHARALTSLLLLAALPKPLMHRAMTLFGHCGLALHSPDNWSYKNMVAYKAGGRITGKRKQQA